jgi:hypothetical protein
MVRQHHYVFGHVALKNLFFHSPRGLVNALVIRGDEFLKEIWDDVGTKVAVEGGEAAKLASEGLSCTRHRIGRDAMAVIVTMPHPEEPPEAYFLGLVLRAAPNQSADPECASAWKARYMTLELGTDRAGAERTFLCEWTENAHLNTGLAPEANVEAFALQLAEMIADQDA